MNFWIACNVLQVQYNYEWRGDRHCVHDTHENCMQNCCENTDYNFIKKNRCISNTIRGLRTIRVHCMRMKVIKEESEKLQQESWLSHMEAEAGWT